MNELFEINYVEWRLNIRKRISNCFYLFLLTTIELQLQNIKL